MDRTIIDIMNVADQERFHSSMIAWLLDPAGEHGLKNEFGNKFFAKIPGAQTSEVKEVKIEKAENGVRFDIWIRVDDDKEIVFENKTKSLGQGSQLSEYRRKLASRTSRKGIVVALGLDDLNFDDEDRKAFPFISYRDVRDILCGMHPLMGGNDYHILIKHYLSVLDRELGRLETIRNAFRPNGDSALAEIESDQREWIRDNDNNKRFYNSFYLALLRQQLPVEPPGGFRWVIDKNVPSGVVMHMANPLIDTEPCPDWGLDAKYLNEASLKRHLRQMYNKEKNAWDASFWIEIELREGVFARDANNCGEIKLKASRWAQSPPATEIQSRFERGYELGEKEERVRRHAREKSETFALLRRPISKAELLLETMNGVLCAWREKHGITLGSNFFKSSLLPEV